MTDTDKHWRYAIATMLILAVFGIGMVVAWHSVPDTSQRILDTLTGGLIGAMTLAVQSAIAAARSLEDASTIKQQSQQLGASTPTADGPTGSADDPLTVEQAK